MEKEPGRMGVKIFLALYNNEPIEELLTEEQRKALIEHAHAHDNGSTLVDRPNPIPLRSAVPRPPETQQHQPLPVEYDDFLIAKGATGNNSPKLIFVKKLFKTDLALNNTRLTMPNKQIRHKFLTDEEKRFFEGRDEDRKPNKLQVIVVDPSMKEQTLNLAKWNSADEKSWSYALNHDWMNIVRGKDLHEGDTIQVWAFRIKRDHHSRLAFMIYKERREDRGSTSCLYITE